MNIKKVSIMKNIILKELTLSNWKAQNSNYVFGANENAVSGRNASGKTSIIKAFEWLLTGYTDANTPANDSLFDNRVPVTPNTPEASVKAVIAIDGETFTLERSAKAKFVRKRGTNEYEKSASDEYSYAIDNISRNATDFKDWISANICPDDMLKFAMDGQYFIAKVFDDKKGARQLIEKLVGTVSRDEMKGDYTDIDELLKKYTPDEIEMQAANLSKGINQRLDEIPSLIRSKENEIAEIEQTDFEGNEREIALLEQERTDLDNRMTNLSERIRPQMQQKYAAERNKQMKQDVYDKAYAAWKKSFETRKQQIADEIRGIKQQNDKSKNLYDAAVSAKDTAEKNLSYYTKTLELAKQKRERLLAERDEEKAKTIDATATICPHCGAELQGDKLQEVLDNFEKVKRERVDAIVAEGKKTAQEIEDISRKIADIQSEIDKPLPEVINQPTDDLEAKMLDIANSDLSKEAFNATEQGTTLLADIEAVVIPEVIMPDNSEIIAAKKEVNDKLTPLYERRGLKSRLQSLKEGIEVLRTEQKEKGSELAKYERQRQLVKDYKQEQMEILSHKVNDGLKFSKIECWSKQKDGTVIGDLVLKDSNGVNFATTNQASRILTSIDVQRFFCEKLGVNLPTFVDESSTINNENLPKLDNVQMFYLFCADTSLKIESK